MSFYKQSKDTSNTIKAELMHNFSRTWGKDFN